MNWSACRLLATAYHVSEVELYKSPWGSVRPQPVPCPVNAQHQFAVCPLVHNQVIKPVASLFSPLLVIPLSWLLLSPTGSSASSGGSFDAWPVAGVLGAVGSLLITGKFRPSEPSKAQKPTQGVQANGKVDHGPASRASIPIAFAVIMSCYAMWNLLQRVSADRYAVNEYEWIVLDKVVGTVWIMLFFVLIDHSQSLQDRLHPNKDYVPFTDSCREVCLLCAVIFSFDLLRQI